MHIMLPDALCITAVMSILSDSLHESLFFDIHCSMSCADESVRIIVCRCLIRMFLCRHTYMDSEKKRGCTAPCFPTFCLSAIPISCYNNLPAQFPGTIANYCGHFSTYQRKL